jgi:hypothetical protein
VAIILATVVGVIAIRASSTASTSATSSAKAVDTADRLSSRRALTADALIAYQAQTECENETFASFDAAVLDVLLTERGSTDQKAALDRLVPVRDDLRTIRQRCIETHPIPETVDATTTTTPG